MDEPEVPPQHLLAPRHPGLPPAQQLHRPVSLRPHPFPAPRKLSQRLVGQHRPQHGRSEMAQLRGAHRPGAFVERGLRAGVHLAELPRVPPRHRVHRRRARLGVERPEELVQSPVLVRRRRRIRRLQVAKYPHRVLPRAQVREHEVEPVRSAHVLDRGDVEVVAVEREERHPPRTERARLIHPAASARRGSLAAVRGVHLVADGQAEVEDAREGPGDQDAHRRGGREALLDGEVRVVVVDGDRVRDLRPERGHHVVGRARDVAPEAASSGLLQE